MIYEIDEFGYYVDRKLEDFDLEDNIGFTKIKVTV